MIKDNIENLEKYKAILPVFNDVIEYLQGKITSIPLKVIPLEYKTKSVKDTVYENHVKNIDMHFIINGVEKVRISKNNLLTQMTDYDEVNDYQLFAGDRFIDEVTLNEGDFLILWPGEIHMTSIHENTEPIQVKKIVLKIPL
ncbi:MAG: YhcH/YjgK/YiaL family protein [Chitinophagales bacterium]|nr:YhcH/YjgK/YiaL family protein [Chitinophagales bacterium]